MRLRRAARSQPLQIAASFAALTATLASLVVAPGLDGLCGAALALLMLTIALTDARYFLIPNELTAAAALLALLRAALIAADPGGIAALIAIARGIGSALPLLLLMIAYRRWRGFDGLGLGDVKLAGVAGLWLGWDTVFVTIEAATLSAIAAFFIVSRRRGEGWRSRAKLPFGVFLAPAIWLGWLAEAWLAS